MSRKRCLSDRELVQFLENEMDMEEEMEIEEHLEECIYCARKMRNMARALKETENMKLPTYEQVIAYVNQENSLKEWLRSFVNWLFSNQKVVLSTAMAVMVLVVFSYVFHVFQFFSGSKHYYPMCLRGGRVVKKSVKVGTAVVIEVEDIDKAIGEIESTIQKHGGEVLQVLFLKDRIRMVAKLDGHKKIFSELSKLGKLYVPEHIYKDKQGNTVILITKTTKK